MPRVILSSIRRSGDDSFEVHNLDFLEICTFVFIIRIFLHSNMFRWCYRSMRWRMRPTGEAGNQWRAPCMESWIFENFMEKLKLVDGLAIKFNEISSLARISLPRGATLVIYVTRRALCL